MGGIKSKNKESDRPGHAGARQNTPAPGQDPAHQIERLPDGR